MTERYRFVSDDDGHWYIIPAHKNKEFEAIVYSDNFEGFPDWVRELGRHISRFSFENPLED